MGCCEDPRERRRAAQEDDPYEHLMDNIDTLLQDDEYEGPDSRRPQRRSAPDQWYDAYGDENGYNDYNTGYDPATDIRSSPAARNFGPIMSILSSRLGKSAARGPGEPPGVLWRRRWRPGLRPAAEKRRRGTMRRAAARRGPRKSGGTRF